MYDAATSECFSFVLAIKISQNTDHHSKRKPPGASIAEPRKEKRLEFFFNVKGNSLKIVYEFSILYTHQQGQMILFLQPGKPEQWPSNLSLLNNRVYRRPTYK